MLGWAALLRRGGVGVAWAVEGNAAGDEGSCDAMKSGSKFALKKSTATRRLCRLAALGWFFVLSMTRLSAAGAAASETVGKL